MCKKKKKKITRKKKKKHKPDETLRDRDVENPYPRMSLASTIVRRSLPFSPDRPRLNVRHPRVQSNGNSARHCFVFNFPAFNTTLARPSLRSVAPRCSSSSNSSSNGTTDERAAALATFAVINTGLILALGINSR